MKLKDFTVCETSSAAPGTSAPVCRPISPLRRAVGSVLSASKRTIPHFYLKQTVDAARLWEFYQRQKAQYPCTLNDVVVLACARALINCPMLRSRIEGEQLVTLPSANIGIAVGVEEGIVVPVVLNAETLDLKELAEKTRRLVDKARKGKIEGMGQGVFTISNLGMFGVPEFAAIINPPEAAILAVGAVRDAAMVRDGALVVGKELTLTLCVDHRIVDGVLAARFIQDVRGMLESLPPG